MTTSAPSLSQARLPSWSLELPGVLLAILAGLRHAVLMTSATNDNFLHLTLAQQWLAGDWPVRDFFDGGWLLQYTLSAAAQLVMGNRLLSEAVIVGAAWAISTYLVYRIVRSVTGSASAAALAALVVMLAAARGYSYPKGIVYAVAGALWWGYVRKPTTARIVVLGAWTAAAFYWRPDHGVYVGIAVALAAWVAHGFGAVWLARCSLAGTTMLAVIAPFLLYVHLTFGLPQYVQTGVIQARVEHTTQGPHEWPLLRFWRSLVTIDPADAYAPVVTIRWNERSSSAERAELLAGYDLTPLESDGDSVRVRLSGQSIPRVRALINESIVDDTAGIDRSAATLSSSSWPAWKRWQFSYAPLRIQVLPTLEGQARATEYTVALFYLLPLLLAAGAQRFARRLPVPCGGRALFAFAVFAFLVDLAMLRVPFTARVFDATVLSAIVFGFCVAALWRARSRGAGGALVRLAAAVAAFGVITTVSRAAQFSDWVTVLADQWGAARSAGASSGPLNELVASPPLSYFRDRPARFTLRLAAYVRDCVPQSDRLLVLWFEPEIYFYSERLMAQRHLVFAPAWATLAHEQNLTLEKIRHFSPPLALARRSALDEYARATYPGVFDYVEREYHLATTVDNDGEQYLIFVRRDRPVLRGFGRDNWPCFTSESSTWARVGQPGS